MAQTNPKQCPNGMGGSHSRSLSQQSFFVNSCLPPLSPLPPSEASSLLSNSDFRNMPIDEIDISSSGGFVSAMTSPNGNPFCCSNGIPPRRGPGHRRCNSDVPLGFSDMIQSSPQMVPVGSHEILGGATCTKANSVHDKSKGLKRQGMDAEIDCDSKVEGVVGDKLFDSLLKLDHVDKDKDTISSSTKMSCGGDSSNSESETVSVCRLRSGKGNKRTASGDVTPLFRHSRSLSTDSGIGNFQFGELSPKIEVPLCNGVDQVSPTSSVNEKLDKIKLEFGRGEFNESEVKKIVTDERLVEIAISDPKRAKRILANRQSAARSKERKMRYIFELENKVQTLQIEATTLSAQITLLQKDHMELTNQNNELKYRIQAMEQQAHLRDALHKTLFADVQRLKLANLGMRDTEQYAPQQPCQIQGFPVTATKTSTAASAAPASA